MNKEQCIREVLINFPFEKTYKALYAIQFGWFNEGTTLQDWKNYIVKRIEDDFERLSLMVALGSNEAETSTGGVKINLFKDNGEIYYSLQCVVGEWDNYE